MGLDRLMDLPEKPAATERALAAKREREARAAEELRKNLRKRKEQARARATETPPKAD